MPGIQLPLLVDGELRLRPPTTDDVPEITRICQDPDIQRWTRVPSPYTTADADDFVVMSRDGLANGTGVHLLAVDTDDRVLGAIGLGIDQRDLTGGLGYWLAPEARGHGYAARGGRLLCRLGFERLDLGYIHLIAGAGNAASNAVARRLGFVHEGTMRQAMIDGPSGNPHAPRMDANLYGLLPDELT